MTDFDSMSTDELEALHKEWLERHGPHDGAVVEIAQMILDRKPQQEAPKDDTYELRVADPVDAAHDEPVNETGNTGEGDKNDA